MSTLTFRNKENVDSGSTFKTFVGSRHKVKNIAKIQYIYNKILYLQQINVITGNKKMNEMVWKGKIDGFQRRLADSFQPGSNLDRETEKQLEGLKYG